MQEEGDEIFHVPAWTDVGRELDAELLEPIQVSGTTSLPDLGMTISLRFRSGREVEMMTHPAAFWPPTRGVTTLPVARMDALQSYHACNSRFLPVIAVACRLAEVRTEESVNMDAWFQRLAKLGVPPLVRLTPDILPHGLLSIESRLMGRAIITVSFGS